MNIMILQKIKVMELAKHMKGIQEYGITDWHRKSFGICKESKLITLN